MAARRGKVIKGALTLLGIGALYALFVLLTGIYLPCPFHLVTHLKCPGCGVTHMCLSLLHLDIKEAFTANAVLLCLLPFMAAAAGSFIHAYIKKGSARDRAAEISVYAMIAVLLVWGVVRNII